MEDKILLKIKKTLELAERAGTEEEANTALKLAQEMMIKYSIEKSDIDGIQDNEIIQKTYNPDSKRTGKHIKIISLTLKEHFPVEVVTLSNKKLKYSRISIVGKKLDCEYFCIMLESMIKQYSKKMNKELKKYIDYKSKFTNYNILSKPVQSYYKTEFKESYLLGFTNGLDIVLKENEVERNLVVVTPHSVMEYVDKASTGKSTVKVKGNSQSQGFVNGFNAGKSTGSDYKKNRLNSPAV